MRVIRKAWGMTFPLLAALGPIACAAFAGGLSDLLADAFNPKPLPLVEKEILNAAHNLYVNGEGSPSLDMEFLRLQERYPFDASVNSLAAARASVRGDIDGAVRAAENAVLGNTFEPALRLPLIQYLTGANQFPVAIALIDAHFAATSDQQMATSQMTEVLKKMNQAAIVAVQAGNITAAVRLIKVIVQRGPQTLFQSDGFASQAVTHCNVDFVESLVNMVTEDTYMRGSVANKAQAIAWAVRAKAILGDKEIARSHASSLLALSHEHPSVGVDIITPLQLLRRYHEAFARHRMTVQENPKKYDASTVMNQGTQLLTIFKLEHDIDQTRYLLDHGIITPSPRLDNMIETYEEALQSIEMKCAIEQSNGVPHSIPDDGLDCDPFATWRYLSPTMRNRVAKHLFTPVNQHAFKDWGATPTVNLANFDWDDVQNRYLKGEVVVLDDVLVPEVLEELYRIGLESTDWNTVKGGGYLGAMYIADGFAPPIIAQLAHDLESAMPRIFARHSLLMFWGFKHDTTLSRAYHGIRAHADTAAVNLNFWVTPDEYNLNPENGGLIVYNRSMGRQDANFHDYNSFSVGEKSFGLTDKDILARVPYRRNRFVMFTSSYLHATDKVEFKKGFKACRINYTLLFGFVESISCGKTSTLQKSPVEQEAANVQAVIRQHHTGDVQAVIRGSGEEDIKQYSNVPPLFATPPPRTV